MSTDALHDKPNGVWSLTWAEINKWVFLSAYRNRIDRTAIQRALMESKSFLERVGEEVNFTSSSESPLLKKWKSSEPKSLKDWQYWIAIHQQHLFLDSSKRGAFFQSFPALRSSDQVADVELTRLFYHALKEFSARN